METGVALRTGLVLAQVGEFGFALLVQAEQYQLFSARTSQIVLAAMVLSMMLAPLIVRYNGRIAKRLVPSYTASAREQPGRDPRRGRHAHGKHVIVCGYGRSGQNLAWMLETGRASTTSRSISIRCACAMRATPASRWCTATPRAATC